MNPKKRLRQSQSGRLYLRRKDHREIILNDIYHNAMWLKKTKDDGTEQDELVWAKFPDRCFLYRTRFPVASTSGAMSSFDIDRQFSTSAFLNMSYNSKCIKLKDFVVIPYYYGANFNYLRITKDGAIFKQKVSPVDYGSNYYRFGGNSIIGFSQSGNVFHCDVVHISPISKSFDFELDAQTHSFATVEASPRYVCATESGCIIAYISGAWCTCYEITNLGARRLHDVAFEIKTSTQPTLLEGYCNENFIAFAIYGRYLDNMNNIVFEHNIFYSTDGGASWNKQMVLQKKYGRMPSYSENLFCFARKGICYVYSIWDGDLVIWASEGGEFTEVETLKGFILSVVKNCGSDIADSSYNTCQIKLKSDASVSADVSYSISGARFDSWNDAIFKYGKLDEDAEGIVFQIMERISGYYYYRQVYIDNPTFQASEDNVIFYYKAFNENNALPDRVMQGDYVLGKTKESEVTE